MKRLAIQKRLLIWLLHEDIVDWLQINFSATFLIEATLGEKLSSRTRTLFSSKLTVMWRKTVSLVCDWDSDQSLLTGTETELQHLFSTVICSLTCRHQQTIDYVFVQTPNQIPQSFISRKGWNNQNSSMMNIQNLSTLQVFQSVTHKWKNPFCEAYPKELIRFLCECIVNRVKGNLQRINRHHVRKIQN